MKQLFMHKLIIPVILCAFILSCKGKAQEVNQAGDFSVELLFEKDGCRMYRFKDGSQYIYWSNCSGKTFIQQQSGGKYSHTETLQQSVATE
jgi:hypothetical protein